MFVHFSHRRGSWLWLSMEDPTPPLDTQKEVIGTRSQNQVKFEGPKNQSDWTLWVGNFLGQPRGTQVLVFGSTYQGAILVHLLSKIWTADVRPFVHLAVAQKTGIPKWVALLSEKMDQNLRNAPLV